MKDSELEARTPAMKPLCPVENPSDLPAAQALISRLCHLHAEVIEKVFGYDKPADCFCGERGFWPYRSAEDFHNDGHGVTFIEEAVRTAIEVARAPYRSPDLGGEWDKALLAGRELPA